MQPEASFGRRLQQLRKSRDLSIAELARHVGCSASTLRKLEIDARRPSRQVAERLAEALQLSSGEHDTFLARARGLVVTERLTETAGSAAGGPDAAHPVSTLPVQRERLIGRERELVHVRALLLRDDVGLVTLTGTGGIGKTRLALAVAAELQNHYADGVFWVDLAPIRDRALVPATIGTALGLRATGEHDLHERLRTYVRSRHLLLLLDNFEQVVAAASIVADLLTTAPRLSVLATSRVRLRLTHEREVMVPPLALPDLRAVPAPTDLARVAAVELFLARAQATNAAVRLTEETAPTLAALCVRLDGLPLALELAAVRSRVFAPRVLLERLTSRLALLTGGARDLPARQQTLRDTIAWSYNLLDAPAQNVFARVAVFVSGWTMEACEALCCADGEIEAGVTDQLQVLIDNSLVRRVVGATGEPRFAMLETIREYALERLHASGEHSALARRHAAYFLDVAEAAAHDLLGPQHDEAVRRLEAEYDNLRAALRTAITHQDSGLALGLSAALWTFWDQRGWVGEGLRWVSEALLIDDPAPRALRATALHGAGWLAFRLHQYPSALALHEESLALRRDLGDHHGVADSLRSVGAVAEATGDTCRAEALAEESLALYRRLGDAAGIGRALNNLATAAEAHNNFGHAIELYEECIAIFQRLGDSGNTATSMNNLAWAQYQIGHFERAAALAEATLALRRSIQDPVRVAQALLLAGRIAHARGHIELAAVRYAEFEALARTHGDDVAAFTPTSALGDLAVERCDYERALSLYEESLGRARRLGESRIIAEILRGMGWLAHERGEPGAALEWYTQSLACYRDNREQVGQGRLVADLACLQVRQGQFVSSARLFGAAQQSLERLGATVGVRQQRFDDDLALVRLHLDPASFESAWAAGQGMTLEQAVAEALETLRAGAAASARPGT